MKTICIQIGNSDNKLTQKEWSAFVSETSKLIAELGADIFFFGGSITWADWQNVCWVIGIEYENELREGLTNIRLRYGQDSIAYLSGATEFI